MSGGESGPDRPGPPELSRRACLWGLAAVLSMRCARPRRSFASRRFFLTDDYATYFMPGFSEIARLLGQGHFPLLTDRIWNGGALLQEYQYAVFNPVSMLLYVVLGQLDDLAPRGGLLAGPHRHPGGRSFLPLPGAGLRAAPRLSGRSPGAAVGLDLLLGRDELDSRAGQHGLVGLGLGIPCPDVPPPGLRARPPAAWPSP